MVVVNLMRILVAITLFSMTSLTWGALERGFDALEQGDFATAHHALLIAAQQGEGLAQYWLGRLYRNGRGVTQNFVEAHRWFNLAAAQGLAVAAQARDQLALSMSPTQIADAQQLALSPQLSASPRLAPSEGLVARVQLALRRLGHDVEVNGQLDAVTQQLIRRYQIGAGDIDDGLPSENLVQQLNASRPQIEAASALPQPPPNLQQWRRVLLEDQFSDGNFSENPPWRVVTGNFWVERGAGLRTDARIDPRVAEIYTPQSLPNAFLIEVLVSARQHQGRLEIGPYRGEQRQGGYRLYYSPGDTGSLWLVHFDGRASQVLARTQRKLDIINDRRHQLLWTRTTDGEMVIQVNGVEMLRVRDLRSADTFDGLVLTNRGGDFGIWEVRVKGAF